MARNRVHTPSPAPTGTSAFRRRRKPNVRYPPSTWVPVGFVQAGDLALSGGLTSGDDSSTLSAIQRVKSAFAVGEASNRPVCAGITPGTGVASGQRQCCDATRTHRKARNGWSMISVGPLAPHSSSVRRTGTGFQAGNQRILTQFVSFPDPGIG